MQDVHVPLMMLSAPAPDAGRAWARPVETTAKKTTKTV